MKVRVYDGGKGYSVDRYSLYFPFTKKMKKETYTKHGLHISGCFLCFSFSNSGITRCCFDYWNMNNGYCDSLGRKIKIETLPKHVQEWIKGYEVAWNKLLKDPQNETYSYEWENYY